LSVQLAILGFLQERNYHGYELKKTIARLMGMWTDIKFGSLYHALGCLEKAGFVCKVETSAAGNRPARAVYGITDNGRAEFARLVEDNILTLRRVYLKDDIGVYFGGRLDRRKFTAILKHKIARLEDVAAELKKHRAYLESIVAERSRAPVFLINRHIMHLEAEIGWFNDLKKSLTEGSLYLKKSERNV